MTDGIEGMDGWMNGNEWKEERVERVSGIQGRIESRQREEAAVCVGRCGTYTLVGSPLVGLSSLCGLSLHTSCGGEERDENKRMEGKRDGWMSSKKRMGKDFGGRGGGEILGTDSS